MQIDGSLSQVDVDDYSMSIPTRTFSGDQSMEMVTGNLYPGSWSTCQLRVTATSGESTELVCMSPISIFEISRCPLPPPWLKAHDRNVAVFFFVRMRVTEGDLGMVTRMCTRKIRLACETRR